MPRLDSEQIVGYSESTDTVWLLGGYYNPRQLLSFNPSSNSFADYGSNALSHDARALAQSFAQLNEFVYYVEYGGNVLRKFNVDLGTEDAFTATIADGAQTYSWTSMCLAALDVDGGYLFVVGGRASSFGSSLAKTFILNLSSNEWFAGQSLNVARRNHACAFDSTQSALFAIGGYDGDGYLDSVEMLNVENIANVENSEWVLLTDTLQTEGLSNLRAVSHGPNILTVGGYDGEYVQVMNVIDTVELGISQSGSLDIGLDGIAPVVVDSTAYCFGGWDDSNSFDSWRFLPLPTPSPTLSPSSPTEQPNASPSHGPTTAQPTAQPTANPTTFPITNPSTSPSSEPSAVPSVSVNESEGAAKTLIFAVSVGVCFSLLL